MYKFELFQILLNIADLDAGSLGEAVRDLTADHAADDAVLAEIVHAPVERFDGLSVADDGDVIGNVGNFIEFVRNDDARESLFLEPQQQIEQCPRILLVQRGGRLVQNHQFGVFRQCLGYFGKLLFTDADVLDKRLGGVRQPDDFQVLRCFGMGRLPVDVELLPPLVAEKHILADGHIGDQRQLLMDDNYTFAFAVLDIREATDLAVIHDVALVRAVRIPAAQHVHQRGFAGTVFTQ